MSAASGPPHLRALADASPRPFWLDSGDAPAVRPALTGDARADLAIVGGGLTGLWAALQAKEEDRAREVVLLEADTIAFGGSGRNGGFVDASLTHGLRNGLDRFPAEIDTLQRLGRENLAGIESAIERHGIDARYEPVGSIDVATAPHELAELEQEAELLRRHGEDAEALDAGAVRALVDSPTYLGGLARRSHNGLVDPARLVWGLARAAQGLGVRIHERSPARRLRRDGPGVVVDTAHGRLRARRALLATNAFTPLVRSIRRHIVPVYDYVLITEPLSRAQRDAIGWQGRQGLSDRANQFHYYRLTDDGRILWGGYDAVYHYGNAVAPGLERRPQTYALLAEHFFATFPQLDGVRFTHAWAGAIDTCSRFCVMFGTPLGGRASYAVGYTGLGVGASRFGARVALDLLDCVDNERTRLALVRTKPTPFPPEPLRWAVIQLTRRELARADRNRGERGLWLRALDRFGLGFDS